MKRTFILSAFLLVVLSFPTPSLAATMSLAPSASSVSTGDIVTVRVIVNPAGMAINNAEALLHFPVDVLQVLSVSKAGSMFPLWVEDPGFSNAAGTVSFNGGIPNPGATSAGTVLSITFHAVHPGTASITLSDTAVRANDGMGTNVLASAQGTQITVAPVVTAVPSVPAVPSPSDPVPHPADAPATPANSGMIAILSSTHQDQDSWYADNNPLFTWDLPKNATSVRLGIDQSATVQPGVSYAKPIAEKRIEALKDGTWYFRMQYRAAGVWSAISTYKVKVDTSAPIITSHDFLYDQTQNAVLVDVQGTDTGSGIASYEISIDDSPAVAVAAEKFAERPQSFPVTTEPSVPALTGEVSAFRVSHPGVHRLTLTAVDGAGNRSSVEGSFSVPPSAISQTLFHIGPVDVSLLTVLIAMLLLTLLSLAAAFLEWGALIRARVHKKPELAVMRKGLQRGFLTMKENMQKDIRALDRARTKRELSREEESLYKRQVENIHTLEKHIDKALDDV